MSEQVFLVALGMVALTVILTVKTVASVIGARRSQGDYAQLRDQVEQQGAALDDAQRALDSQGSQIAELQERVDFAERLLAQARERGGLKPGEP